MVNKKVKITGYEIIVTLSNGKTIDISNYYNKNFDNYVQNYLKELENDFENDFQDCVNA
jgi:hypothetical protein